MKPLVCRSFCSRMRAWLRASVFLLPLVVMAGLLEWGVREEIFPRYLVASPSMVWTCFGDNGPALIEALWQTACASFLGFGTSCLVGSLLGLLFFSWPVMRRLFFPYVTLFQTVPIIAVAPLFVIWFGYGLSTVWASSFIVSVFPMIAATLKGLASTENSFAELFQLYGARPWQTLLWLRLPFALPQLFVGAQIASGLSVIGAIVGEFIAGGGLGGLIDTARAQQKTELIFAALLLATLLGLFSLRLCDLIFGRLLKTWHPSERTIA